MYERLSRVLVIRFGPVGDFVLSLPAMERIRKAHPRAEITLLTTARFEALARSCPYFNHINSEGDAGGLGGMLALRGRLKQGRFERIYDLQCDARSAAIFQSLWPGAPPWSGVAPGCSLPHKNPRRDKMHVLERQADQLRQAGIWDDAPVEPGTAPSPDLSWILKRAPNPRPVPGQSKPRPYVLLAPGGSLKADRRWPLEHFAELASALSARGFDIVVLGGPEESAMGRTIQRAARNTRDLTGRSDFNQIAILGAKAALAVGNDSGAIQLIASAGAPTIALFPGESDPAINGPRGYVTVMQGANLKDMPVSQVLQAASILTGSS